MVKTLLISFFLCIFSFSFSQTTKDTIPLDPHVHYGKLENGFTYYIQNDKTKGEEVELKFIVKVGLANQAIGEEEVAHVIEHLGNRASTNFPNGIGNYLKSQGLIHGSDFKAATLFGLTEYNIKIPFNKPDLLSNSFLVTLDRAVNLLFKQEEFNAELGAVGNESNGNTNQNFFQMTSMVLDHPKYTSDRFLKSRETVKKLNRDAVFSFYKKWYRPDLMAIIIIGNVNAIQIEKEVKKIFGQIKSAGTKVNNADSLFNAYKVQLDGKNKFILLEDKTRLLPRVDIYIRKPGFGKYGINATISDYKQSLIVQLYNEMSKSRLASITWPKNATPFHYMERPLFFSSTGINALVTAITIDSAGLKKSFQTSFNEIERIKRYGFGKEEFEAAKLQLQKVNDRENFASDARLSDKYKNHFAYNTAAPSFDYRQSLNLKLISEISVEDVNSVSKEWFTEDNKYIVVTAPDLSLPSIPDEISIGKWVEEVKLSVLDKFQFNNKNHQTDLISPKELQGLKNKTSYKKQVVSNIGLARLRLNNGVVVILKNVSTETGKPRVFLHGFSKGGVSMYKGLDSLNAVYGANRIAAAGVGSIENDGLKQYLDKRNISITPYVDECEIGIKGNSPAEGVESLLQLVYLYSKFPRNDSLEFYKSLEKALSTNKSHVSVADSFYQLINTGIWGSNTKKITNDIAKQIAIDKSLSIYKELFNNQSNFTFVISGDIDIKKITPLVVKYLGSLSSGKVKPKKYCSQVSVLHMDTSKVVLRGHEENKVLVRKLVQGQYHFNQEENIKLDVLKELLNNLLFNQLREKLGGTYSVSTSLIYKDEPAYFQLFVQFECAAGKEDILISAMNEEIEKIKRGHVSESDFKNSIVSTKSKYSKNIRSAQFWANYLVSQVRSNIDLAAILQYERLLNSITVGDISTAANKYLTQDNSKLFVLLPKAVEKKKTNEKSEAEKEAIRIAEQLNLDAWKVFLKSSDPAEMQKALKWSEESQKVQSSRKNLSAYFDTYANLLYKLKRKDSAIINEQKSFSFLTGQEKMYNSSLQRITTGEEKISRLVTLFKMEKDEPTWPVESQNFASSIFGQSDNIYWSHIRTWLNQSYLVEQSDSMILLAKIDYYRARNNKPAFTESVVAYLTKYVTNISLFRRNDYAWSIFLHSNKPEELKSALSWLEVNIKDTANKSYHTYLDTYANILHKLGETNWAIEWEEKAIAIAPENLKLNYQAVLDKMRKGEQTW